MPDPAKPGEPPAQPDPRPAADCDAVVSDAVLCERCGSASVYRMHAVWRCADCGYKTDCCGW